MKALHVIPTLNPLAGGPPDGIKSLISGLSKLGCESSVITLDDPSSEWLEEYKFNLNALGNNGTKYSYSKDAIKTIKKSATDYQFILVHGIWQFHSLAVYLALRNSNIPYYVYIHGALDPWFKKYYPLKHIKKYIYWILFEHNILKSAEAVLYTSEEEKLLARKSFKPYSFKESVVGFGKEDKIFDFNNTNYFLSKYPVLKDKKILLYVSRIHQKKGFDVLLNAFNIFSNDNPEYYLVMMGPDPENFKNKYNKKFSSSINKRIIWTGWVDAQEKWDAYKTAEAYILSSHSENWGATVVESLMCGTPVLLSNKVNIWREVVKYKAGFVEDDTVQGTKKLLTRWAELDQKEKIDMKDNSRKCFKENFDNINAAKILLKTVQDNE